MIQWDYVDKLEHSTDRDGWSVEATHEKALDFDIMKKRGCGNTLCCQQWQLRNNCGSKLFQVKHFSVFSV